MTRTRWTGLAGLLFAIGFALTVKYAGSTPDTGGSDAAQKYADYWKDTTHQSHAVWAAFLLSYSFLLLIAFVVGLRDRLRTVDSGPWPAFVLAAGVTAAALLLVGGQIGLAIGVTADQAKAFKVDGSTAMLFDNAAYQVMAPAFMAAAVMAVFVGLVTLRTRVLPVWTAWLGFLLGLTAVGSFFTAWIGFVGFPLWAAVIGIVLLLQKDDAPAAAEAPVMASTA